MAGKELYSGGALTCDSARCSRAIASWRRCTSSVTEYLSLRLASQLREFDETATGKGVVPVTGRLVFWEIIGKGVTKPVERRHCNAHCTAETRLSNLVT